MAEAKCIHPFCLRNKIYKTLTLNVQSSWHFPVCIQSTVTASYQKEEDDWTVTKLNRMKRKNCIYWEMKISISITENTLSICPL